MLRAKFCPNKIKFYIRASMTNSMSGYQWFLFFFFFIITVGGLPSSQFLPSVIFPTNCKRYKAMHTALNIALYSKSLLGAALSSISTALHCTAQCRVHCSEVDLSAAVHR